MNFLLKNDIATVSTLFQKVISSPVIATCPFSSSRSSPCANAGRQVSRPPPTRSASAGPTLLHSPMPSLRPPPGDISLGELTDPAARPVLVEPRWLPFLLTFLPAESRPVASADQLGLRASVLAHQPGTVPTSCCPFGSGCCCGFRPPEVSQPPGASAGPHGTGYESRFPLPALRAPGGPRQRRGLGSVSGVLHAQTRHWLFARGPQRPLDTSAAFQQRVAVVMTANL